jgi:hypothetical protein
MIGLCEAVLDIVVSADIAERVAHEASGWPVPVLGQWRELDAIIGQDRMDAIGNNIDQCLKECPCSHGCCPILQTHEGKLAGPVYGDERFEHGGPSNPAVALVPMLDWTQQIAMLVGYARVSTMDQNQMLILAIS